MTNVTTAALLESFPMQSDGDMCAVAAAIAPELVSLFEDCSLCSIYPRIDELDEVTLDRIAIDYSVSWYDYNSDLESKRAQIQDLFKIHKIAGTKQGLKDALAVFCTSVDVEEWFEYNGDPGSFRVTVTPKTGVSSATILALLHKLKRISTDCESIQGV